MITEHAVNMALHHGLLLAGTDCVLQQGAEERAAEITSGTYQTAEQQTPTRHWRPRQPRELQRTCLPRMEASPRPRQGRLRHREEARVGKNKST